MKSLLKQYQLAEDKNLDRVLQKLNVSEERLEALLKTWIEQNSISSDNSHLEELNTRKKQRREKEILERRAKKLKTYQKYRDSGLSLQDTASAMKQTEEKMALFLEHETERQKKEGLSVTASAKELRVSPECYQRICQNAEDRKAEKIRLAKQRLADNRIYSKRMLKKISEDLETGSSNIFIFDIEASQHPDEPIEISIIDCHGHTILDQLIRPSGTIDWRIVKLTGITNAMVIDQPDIHAVMPKIRELTSGKTLLSWGSDYDALLMKNACQMTGITLSCTFGCAQKVHMGCIDAPEQIALSTAAGCHNQSHRALDDCRLVLKILKEDILMKKRHP